MTGKDRLLAALAGDRPDRVPFVPNIWQWFHVNRQRGTLPDPLRTARGPVDALRILGADVMSKFDGLVLRPALRRCAETVCFAGDPLPEPTPLKQFHWLAGPQATTFFLADHFDAMRQLADIHRAKSLAALEEVIDLDGVWAFEVPDNLDSLLYSPTLFREFCLPVLQKSARMIHARGKYLFIHACGRLKALAPLLLESQLDCVEGQAHPPLGDWRLDEARALSPRLIVCGGMTAVEQQWTGPDTAARLDQHVRQVMLSMGAKRRFLFASGCNTSPNTPYENLLAFRDAAWRYGEVQ